jgi:O-acetylserine/cysteine efflux transporter
MAADPPHPRPFGATDLMVVVAMNVMWGLNIVAIKEAVGEVAPITAAALRQALVLLVCLSSLRIVPGRMRALAALGVLSGGAFYLVNNWAIALATNVSALAIAGQLGVPFAMLGAVLVFRERIHWPRMIGIALSVAGVVLLVFDPAAAREGPGLALTALASAIWAGCSLIQRRLAGVPILTTYAWIGLGGVLTLAPVAWLAEPDAIRALPQLPLGSLGWIAFSAFGSTLIGHGSMAWLLQRHPVTMVTPLTLASPVIAVVSAAWWFGNPLTPIMILGGAVAMLGVGIVTVRTARAERREGRVP